MSCFSGPEIVNTNLILCYDMYNTKKSFVGEPTTNLFLIPTPDSSGNVTFPANGTGTFQRIFSGKYNDYTITPTDVVYKYNLGVLGCHYHGYTGIAITAGQTATFSCDYYISPTTTGYPETNYLANFEGTVSSAVADPTPSIIGVWKRFTFSATAATTGTFSALLYPGACGSARLASGGFILYKNPQVELKAYNTPFIAGTRSNTQALIDLTSRNTITATSLTYASDNTFSFDGINNYGWIGNLGTFPSTGTIDFWMNSTAVESYRNPFHTNYTGTGNNTGIRFEQATGGQLGVVVGNDAGTYVGYALTTSLQANTWYNVVVTWNTATSTLTGYLNTVQGFTTTSHTYWATTMANVAFGVGFTLARAFKGAMPMLKIYNKTLTADEVKQNFNASRIRFGL